jgi:hypothetical protein
MITKPMCVGTRGPATYHTHLSFHSRGAGALQRALRSMNRRCVISTVIYGRTRGPLSRGRSAQVASTTGGRLRVDIVDEHGPGDAFLRWYRPRPPACRRTRGKRRPSSPAQLAHVTSRTAHDAVAAVQLAHGITPSRVMGHVADEVQEYRRPRRSIRRRAPAHLEGEIRSLVTGLRRDPLRRAPTRQAYGASEVRN